MRLPQTVVVDATWRKSETSQSVAVCRVLMGLIALHCSIWGRPVRSDAR